MGRLQDLSPIEDRGISPFINGFRPRHLPIACAAAKCDKNTTLERHESKALLRLQLREQYHVADAFLAEQHHAKAVDPQAHATRRRHAVFERNQKVFVELLLFAAGLVLQPFALLDWIVARCTPARSPGR